MAPNRLADSTSPYLLAHASNPVAWWPWGAEAFAEAKRRDVPVFVSIGYATCHWCHVMARESFSDPVVAAYLDENFVAIKVDREEHPDVDASYLAAAGAFTKELGWPLSVFTTPDGLAFFAGTYFPPRPVQGVPEFLQVLGAVTDAWADRRADVLGTASAIGEALAAAGAASAGPHDGAVDLPDAAALDDAAGRLIAHEDHVHGGFGTAPKFPVAPVLGFLLEGGGEGGASALRTLKAMGASALRDSVEGGFFRYATRPDWTEPHYERMLYDNALLLGDYTTAWAQSPDRNPWAATVASEVARFLLERMQLPDGGFASAQDSESTIDGRRSEGGYYALDREARTHETPPALDRKLLTGWNGLAIGALSRAGFALDRAEWIAAATRAADLLLDRHVRPDRLVRSSLDGRASDATATLEDYGMLAGGLIDLALASGVARYAVAARDLIDAVTPTDGGLFAVPGGPDPVLASQGIALGVDPSEGAYPSGLTATADAAHRLFLLTADRRFLDAARTAIGFAAPGALANPLAAGGALASMRRLTQPIVQLVTVVPDAADAQADASADAHAGGDALAAAARRHPASVSTIVTDAQASAFADAGFELLEFRTSIDGAAAAYLCSDFVCRLPVTEPSELQRQP
ncbi:thioredoxin domain-containing protein [Leifsonia flava]|uniref:Thioredoxin domain-containing protein n=1 Tax=Orlajensenia leifsoniae TaxID=2561933 RepID=A0A4Y9R4Y5_9MICO|nr:DUF255 domain-containing protein [Leifsonia flava]TFV99694.1 thioredoxin domain-containing protein [Leifsonia flava]